MIEISKESLENTLRLVVIASNDILVKQFILDTLKESPNEVVDKLNKTCWSENIDFDKYESKHALRTKIKSQIVLNKGK